MALKELLLDEQILNIRPILAKEIGLNEAIIVQQVHYWIKRSKNKRDGELWVHKSYEEWAEEFPFWSVRTIMRIIKNLESRGILIKGRYSSGHLNRTNWYRINYQYSDNLAQADDDNLSPEDSDNLTQPDGDNLSCGDSDKLSQTDSDKLTQSDSDKLSQTDSDNLSQPNRDYLTENTNKDYITERKEKTNKKKSSAVASGVADSETADELAIYIVDYLNLKTGKNFKATAKVNQKGIRARANDGYTWEQMKDVIDTKTAEWLGTDMAKHLNPETLFRPGNFEKYLNQEATKSKPHPKDVHLAKMAQWAMRKDGLI